MARIFAILFIFLIFTADRVRGTLVIAVPVNDGLVTCADKRLFNVDAGTFTDTNVKIRKAGATALFVATNTVGIYDSRARKMAFDASDVVSSYATGHEFRADQQYWPGLKKEIADKLREYFANHSYSEWPETDKANNNLLFNLFFFSVSGRQSWSHTLKVSYKKERRPVINVSGPVTESVRLPKLSGKGREIIGYISMDPTVSNDPSILRFDERIYRPETTSVEDAVAFSGKLFNLTNSVLPNAHVSSSFDCALLAYDTGFRLIDTASTAKIRPAAIGKHDDQ